MNYYLAIESIKLLICSTMWNVSEMHLLSERNQSQKLHNILFYLNGIFKGKLQG